MNKRSTTPFALSTAGLLAAAAIGNAAAADVKVAGTAPSQVIAGQFIVVFKPHVHSAEEVGRDIAQGVGGQVLHSYEHVFKGMAIRIPAAAETAFKAALARNPNVLSVEQDSTVSGLETVISPARQQSSAPWGLDRIDQASLPLSTT